MRGSGAHRSRLQHPAPANPTGRQRARVGEAAHLPGAYAEPLGCIGNVDPVVHSSHITSAIGSIVRR